MLRGHDNNVVDLAWSPDSTQLASASLDNLLIVWALPSGGKVATVRAHHGYVRGVAWDPFNVYLASQVCSAGTACAAAMQPATAEVGW